MSYLMKFSNSSISELRAYINPPASIDVLTCIVWNPKGCTAYLLYRFFIIGAILQVLQPSKVRKHVSCLLLKISTKNIVILKFPYGLINHTHATLKIRFENILIRGKKNLYCEFFLMNLEHNINKLHREINDICSPYEESGRIHILLHYFS